MSRTKRCIKCKKVKSLNAFYKRGNRRSGYRSQCKQCMYTRSRKYVIAHREQYQAYQRKYYAQNPEKGRIYSREYRAKYPEKVRVATQKWRDEHREETRTYSQEYRKKYPEQVRTSLHRYYYAHQESILARASNYRAQNREKLRVYNREYQATYPEMNRKHCRIRRARRMQALGTFTVEDERRLYELCNHQCLGCGTTKDLTIDHIIPLSKGGTNSLENCQILCRSCNSKKGIKTTDYR